MADPTYPGSGSRSNAAQVRPSQKSQQNKSSTVVPTGAPQSAKAGTSPDLPSRVSLTDLNLVNFGLRLNFPEAPKIQSASYLELLEIQKRRLENAELVGQMLTGKTPSTVSRIEWGKLAKHAWYVFSHHVSPGIADKLVQAASKSGTSGGVQYELDVTLITESGAGGGLLFTVKW